MTWKTIALNVAKVALVAAAQELARHFDWHLISDVDHEIQLDVVYQDGYEDCRDDVRIHGAVIAEPQHAAT